MNGGCKRVGGRCPFVPDELRAAAEAVCEIMPGLSWEAAGGCLWFRRALEVGGTYISVASILQAAKPEEYILGALTDRGV